MKAKKVETVVRDPKLFKSWFEKEQKIQIINSEDLPVDHVLNMIGLSKYQNSFGITDEEEIKKRTLFFSFFEKHPEALEYIKRFKFVSSMPNDQKKFLDYFDETRKHNPYWEKILEFVEFFEKYDDVPKPLKDFMVEIKKDHKRLEEEETVFGKEISQEIEKTSIISGIVNFSGNISAEELDNWEIEKRKIPRCKYINNKDESQSDIFSLKFEEKNKEVYGDLINYEVVSGYKAFSSLLSDVKKEVVPAWCYKWLWKILGFKKRMQKRIDRKNKQLEKDAYKSMTFHFDEYDFRLYEQRLELFDEEKAKGIEDIITSKNDIINALEKAFSEVVFSKHSCVNEIFPDATNHLFNGGIIGVKGKLYFSFDKNGLQVRIINACADDDHSFNFERGSKLPVGNSLFLEVRNFKGISVEHSKFLSEKEMELAELINKANEGVDFSRFILWITEKKEDFFSSFSSSSINFDSSYQWKYINTMYKADKYKERVEKFEEYRAFARTGFHQLGIYLDISEKIHSFAKKFNSPVCVPEILPSTEHVVEFDNLLPLDMIMKRKLHEKENEDFVPVLINNFPRINGDIIFLTGFHGGGKTTAGQTGLYMTYMALSGIPVFAKSFKTNPKTALGSIVSSEGVDSTATVLIKKSAALLEKASEIPNNQILFFIDEIGKGTQESAGIELGLDLLETFSEKGISLIVNSQIIALAEAAQKHYGALCLKVDENHSFQKGIADGGMDKLRKKTGIDKYIKKSKISIS
ncbi:hypothetical protein EOL94_01385 [bacterium]|nr:hypothetical protein [bacterium]